MNIKIFLKMAAIISVAVLSLLCYSEHEKLQEEEKVIIDLPAAKKIGNVSLEETLVLRRSYRDYSNTPLTLEEAAQILWAAQGIKDNRHSGRTAPSAGATYPLEVYFIPSNVEGIEIGLYKYLPSTHQLEKISSEDKKEQVYNAALSQSSIKNCSALILISGVYERTTFKYGERGIRYVHMEAGHAAQNIYLQGAALQIGTVVIGAFQDEKINRILEFNAEEELLYIMPIGKL